MRIERNTMNNLENEKLHCGKFIADGTFGAVYEGDYDGQKVAVKLLDFGDNREEEEAFRQEASVWSKLNHPNVAKFIGATQLNMRVRSPSRTKNHREKLYGCMVSEFLEGGTLISYLWQNRKKRLSFDTVIQLALDVARGLAYLHSEKVVHRDVKTNNMVLDGQGRVKLIDFGLSRKEASNPCDMTGNTGTKQYMAPEVRRCRPYVHKCDVFSFGICLWEMFYCRRFYCSIMRMTTRPRIHSDCPRKLADLMNRCWLDVERRPEMAEIVKVLEGMSATASEEANCDQKKNFKGCFTMFRRS